MVIHKKKKFGLKVKKNEVKVFKIELNRFFSNILKSQTSTNSKKD
jgi:hypothetical protein